MTQVTPWEYRREMVDLRRPHFDDCLAAAGAEGWELVHLAPRGSDALVIFKRPKPPTDAVLNLITDEVVTAAATVSAAADRLPRTPEPEPEPAAVTPPHPGYPLRVRITRSWDFNRRFVTLVAGDCGWARRTESNLLVRFDKDPDTERVLNPDWFEVLEAPRQARGRPR
jgi:hypothetical protein